MFNGYCCSTIVGICMPFFQYASLTFQLYSSAYINGQNQSNLQSDFIVNHCCATYSGISVMVFH